MLAEPTHPEPQPAAATSPLKKWKIAPVDFGIFIALLFTSMSIFSTLAGKIVLGLNPVNDGEETPMMVTLSQTLGMQVGMLVAYLTFRFVLLQRLSSDSIETATARAPLPQAIAAGLKWLLISYPFVIVAHFVSHSLLSLAGFEQIVQEPIRLLREGGSPADRFLMYFMILVGAPVAEELVFRGAIFRYLHHRLPLFLALGVSGALFALTHYNLYSFAALMTLGVTLALSYRETNSLIAPMVLHTLFNTTNLILILQTDLPQ